jgi:hypothetical protein
MRLRKELNRKDRKEIPQTTQRKDLSRRDGAESKPVCGKSLTAKIAKKFRRGRKEKT